jgi:hypothetical protein
MRTLAKFLAGCIRSIGRPHGSCRFPLTLEQTELAKRLTLSLQGTGNTPTPGQMGELVENVQKLFFACVTRRGDEVADKRFQCPIQCFIAAFSYKVDNTFKTPKDMTGVLSTLHFVLRATALYESELVRAASEQSEGQGASKTMLRYECLLFSHGSRL